MTCGHPVGQADVWSDVLPHPHAPLMPPQAEASGGQEWNQLASHSLELIIYYLQCSIDHLECSRVHPHPQYRHLVLKNGTTEGQHDFGQTVGQADACSDVLPTPNTPMLPQCPHPYHQ